MRQLSWLIGFALVVAACSGSDSPAPTTTPAPAAPVTTSSTTSTTPPADAAPPTLPTTTTVPPSDPVCLQGTTTFTTRGLVATLGAGTGDAAAIGGIRWATHGTCERLVIDLLTADGAPAGSLGEANVQFQPEQGIVRIELPVAVTGIADSLIEGDIVERVFVVRTATGMLAVDIHIGTEQPVVVRGFEVGEPTRVVLDLTMDEEGIGLSERPAVASNVVVLSPPAGPTGYPIVITGYARTFEANVIAQMVHEGAVAGLIFTTATDWLEAWGEFELRFEEGPVGDVMLLVGEESARDGTFEGVTVRLDTS